MKKIENDESEIKERLRGQEIMRLCELGRSASADELLEAALNGRTKNRENVAQLFSFVQRHFSEDTINVRGVVLNRYWAACQAFLKTTEITDAELKKLRHPFPQAGEPGFESILDEMRDEGLLT
jgi:hypothetical protein